MAFSASLKRTLRARAHFACCICFAKGVHIHHIIPQEEGGPDTETNAAPLCPSCHDAYGDNPRKRSFIREARDNWYRICSDRFRAPANAVEASMASMLRQSDRAAPRSWMTVDQAIAALLNQRFSEVRLPGTSWASVESLLSIVLRPQFWPDSDWRMWRAALLRTFGRRVAGRLLLQVLLEQGQQLGRGLDSEQAKALIAQYRTMVLVIVAGTIESSPELEYSYDLDNQLKVRLAQHSRATS